MNSKGILISLSTLSVEIDWDHYLNLLVLDEDDPSSISLTTDLEPMPSKRSGIITSNVNGFIHVYGRKQNQVTLDSNERYDPVKNTLTIESPMLVIVILIKRTYHTIL